MTRQWSIAMGSPLLENHHRLAVPLPDSLPPQPALVKDFGRAYACTSHNLSVPADTLTGPLSCSQTSSAPPCSITRGCDSVPLAQPLFSSRHPRAHPSKRTLARGVCS